ncbi:MAG: hypothetical protein [Caudoviricetes sp.]|nr:MAG: hypothetical protein [Caudoviricetes sp.]
MIKETVTYTDFTGKERTEDLYFHMTLRSFGKLAKNDFRKKGDQALADIRADEDRGIGEVIDVIDELVKSSYGTVKTDEDGTIRFVRNEEKTKEFLDSDAYDAFLAKMISDPTGNSFNEFVTNLIPTGLSSGTPAHAAPSQDIPRVPAQAPTNPVLMNVPQPPQGTAFNPSNGQ